MSQLDNSFNPDAIERALYAEWEESGYFTPSPAPEPYSIAIPPPNVTGTLHIGHAFQHTLMDALIRYQRMSGKQTLWQMGTDHAGIATQMIVTEQMATEGVTLEDLGRDAFIERVWKWRQESGGTISEQMRRMGSSVDWSRERFTMDEGFSRAVKLVFIQLYEKGLIYRGKRLVNWDPLLNTALSDLEVINEDEPGSLWHFRYPLEDGLLTPDGKEYVVVATTRPETMLGDTAIAVHPDDDRYRSLVGKHAVLPLVGRKLPIISDAYVDPEFGTGCVKITPAHDFSDNEIGRRHGLEEISILSADATINANAPVPYRNLDRFEARKRVIADLDALGLLEAVEDHTIKIPRGERSGEIVEPRLTDQWFVKIEPLAGPAITAVENGDITFIPKQYENLYFAWMRDVRDWCISRQQWWGHQIPAWYDGNGNVYVGQSEEAIRSDADLDADIPLTQDPDVLETWFSSALWTFATLGWPDKTPELDQYHPTSVLVTGHDIIFFWVARMIMMTLHFTGEIPFKQVYVHGLIRDAKGEKMSKTKGNGIDPLDVIDGISLDDLVAKRTQNLTQPRMAEAITLATQKEYPNGIRNYGSDALRFTFCAYASPGRNINFDLNRVEGYHNFCNKLWNASRFVMMNAQSVTELPISEQSLADRWIVSRMRQLIIDTHEAVGSYRFDLFANAVYEFIWHEYCDWYVELTKSVFFDAKADQTEATAASTTLVNVLEMLLRVAHPIMPYITETLWREIAPLAGIDAKTIMLRPFPQKADADLDEEAATAIEWLKDVVTAVRNIRGERGVKPSQSVVLMLQGGTTQDKQLSITTEKLLQRQAKLSGDIVWLKDDDPVPAGSVQLVHRLKVIVPFTDLDEAKAEQQRLSLEIQKLQTTLGKIATKLDNPNFVEKAPANVVAKEKTRLDELSAQVDTLLEQRVALENIIDDNSTS
ncbi:MAG: valine--tRNA ligase [Pseudomonadota bacterium]|nr:valine--tRNA ligase [Pseudomonadota bacterium]